MNEGTLKLPKQVKDTLVVNLRSGKFTQYKGAFRHPNVENCYCVLGILGKALKENFPTCTVSFFSGRIDGSPVQIDVPNWNTYLYDFDSKILWIENGITYEIPALAALNDGGFTFEQIADVIEYFY